MKKIISILLCIVLLASMLACGKKEEAPAPTLPPQDNAGDMQVYDEAIPAYDPEAEQEENQQEAVADLPPFEPFVIVDNEFCRAEVTGIDPNGNWGFAFDLLLENKTNFELYATLSEASVNDWMCDPGWSYYLEPGAKETATVSFADDLIAPFDLTRADLTQIIATLKIHVPENGEAGYLVDEYFCVYPYGSGAHMGSTPNVPIQTSFFDTNEYTFSVTNFNATSQMGYAMQVFMENRTGETLYFTFDNVTVNGASCDPYWIQAVSGHMRALTNIEWFEHVFAEAGIDINSVKEIGFELSVYDGNGNYLLQNSPCIATP